jgi:hypothetical protein
VATYYVDYVGGSDAANGTSTSTPWKYDPEATDATGVSAGTTLNPNDVVIFKGGVVHSANHNCSDAGTAGNLIVRKSGHLVGWGTTMAIIDGDAFAYEIWDVKPGAHYLKFDSLEVRNFGTYGFAIVGANGCVITGCKVHTRGTSGSGNSECIFVSGVTSGEISYNEVYDSKWNAINVQSSINVKIKYNYVHGPNVHGGINIMSDTSSYYGMMDGNDVIGNRVIQMGSLVGCFYSRYQQNCIVANNVFDSSDQVAEHVAYITYGGTGGPTNYSAPGYKFYNNTLIGGKWSFANESAGSITVQNNIMLNPDGTYFVNVYATATSNHFDFNCYYASAGTHYWQWLGGGALDFAAWKTASGETANAMNSNPLLSSYRLSEGSPCIDKGKDLTASGGLAYDLASVARPQRASWDMGAYELMYPGVGGGKMFLKSFRRRR